MQCKPNELYVMSLSVNVSVTVERKEWQTSTYTLCLRVNYY